MKPSFAVPHRLVGIFLFFLAFFARHVVAQPAADPFLETLDQELAREMKEMSKAGQPPYFLAYRVNDVQSAYLTSSFGSVIASDADRTRILFTDIKVGDYSFDNSHPLSNFDDISAYDYGGRYSSAQLPLDDKPEAIKLILWQQTQNAYRQALASYKALRNTPKSQTKQIDDFSKESASVHIEPPTIEFNKLFDAATWREKVKKYSAPFAQHNDIIDGMASLEVMSERKYFTSSEGARVVQNRTFAYLTIQGSVRAEDGDVVPLHLSYFATEPAGLPADDKIMKDVEAMISKLEILRKAPVAEPYTGPAILYSRAAGVFFHEIFGHRVEGHRLKDNNDGQTFKAQLSGQVLPKSLSVVFDPTLKQYGDQALNGHYLFDDEGIAARRVKVVENGVLKSFLMSRTPIEQISNSNGHGRAQSGAPPVSRQSNLIIENTKVVSMTQMRKMLISECKKQRKAYGYLFMDVVGGFTTTDRHMPNAFNIFPTEVYRVYTDGRPDELVRGVDLIGTPLAMFAAIEAADDQNEVFTGFCGAESGSVPVTAIAPSLFVKRIETQKKPLTQLEKSLLTRPSSQQ